MLAHPLAVVAQPQGLTHSPDPRRRTQHHRLVEVERRSAAVALARQAQTAGKEATSSSAALDTRCVWARTRTETTVATAMIALLPILHQHRHRDQQDRDSAPTLASQKRIVPQIFSAALDTQCVWTLRHLLPGAQIATKQPADLSRRQHPPLHQHQPHLQARIPAALNSLGHHTVVLGVSPPVITSIGAARREGRHPQEQVPRRPLMEPITCSLNLRLLAKMATRQLSLPSRLPSKGVMPSCSSSFTCTREMVTMISAH